MAVLTSRELKEELLDLNETRRAVENAENRARQEDRRSERKAYRKNKREYAQALHNEADQLFHSGDYESALVLYHRAAGLFPRDSSHSVAARRTAAMISSCNNPTKALKKVLPNSKADGRLPTNLCPETAAVLANEKLKKLPTPSSVVEVLSYFDSHKSFWKSQPSPRVTNTQLSRSRTMLKQLNNLAEVFLQNLQSAFNSGKMPAALKIAQELLVLSAGLQDPSRYQIAAYNYLSLIHVALGRHDRAVSNVSRLVRLSKSTEDVLQLCRALVTLGKVHLSFGHLDAAARAWEYLSKDLKEPIPVAWIRHEIGRCYLETGKCRQALEMASNCAQAAVEGNSKKWILHGKLLQGQCLAKLGRFAESLEELNIAAKITEEEGDTPLLSYIRDLIDQVGHALRSITFDNCAPEESRKEDFPRQSLFGSRAETVITTMFYQRQVITEYRDRDSSTEESMDERITTRSEKILSQSYRESSATDLEQRDEPRRGGDSTFRVDEGKLDRSSSSSPTTETWSCYEEELGSVERESENRRKYDTSKSDNSEDEEAALECQGGSEASLKSTNTNATYVIAKESPTKMVEHGSTIERVKGISSVVDRASDGMSGSSNKIATEEEEDVLNAIRTMEKLGAKDEMELLDMLRDMLLTDGEEDRSVETGRTLDPCEDS